MRCARALLAATTGREGLLQCRFGMAPVSTAGICHLPQPLRHPSALLMGNWADGRMIGRITAGASCCNAATVNEQNAWRRGKTVPRVLPLIETYARLQFVVPSKHDLAIGMPAFGHKSI